MKIDAGAMKKKYYNFFIFHTIVFVLYLSLTVIFYIFPDLISNNIWIFIGIVFVILPFLLRDVYFGFKYQYVRPRGIAGFPILRGRTAIFYACFFLFLSILVLSIAIKFIL